MIRRLFFCVTIMATVLLASCSEDTSYGVSPCYELAFSTDTVRFDTVFSTVPSSTRYFWVYNKNAEGVRLKSVRLDGMNQRGFRVKDLGLDPFQCIPALIVIAVSGGSGEMGGTDPVVPHGP